MSYFDVCDETSDWLPTEYVIEDYVSYDDYYMDEKWKYIKDHPEYMVSNKGRIWSTRTNRFIKGTPLKRSGHIDVSFKYGDKRDHRYLHRLVAEAFIPNNNNLPYVRHLDDDPSYNGVENLAWGTQTDNMRDCIENGNFNYLSDYDREKAMQKRRMAIIAIDREGNETRYISQQEASRKLNVSQRDISSVISGKRNSAKGYKFIKDGSEK